MQVKKKIIIKIAELDQDELRDPEVQNRQLGGRRRRLHSYYHGFQSKCTASMHGFQGKCTASMDGFCGQFTASMAAFKVSVQLLWMDSK